MELATVVVLGMLGTYALMWSIAIDDSEGPFRIYQYIRFLATHKKSPPLIRENASCPYCVSFWAGGMMAVLTVLALGYGMSVATLAKVFILTYGYHGACVFWMRYMKSIYQLGSRDL